MEYLSWSRYCTFPGVNWVECSLPDDSIVENVENYMEYAYCSKMFTLGQSVAMTATLMSAVSGRNNLSTYLNHVATGTDTASLTANPYVFPAILSSLPVCAPKADFSANKFLVCQGGTVTFTNQSFNAPTTGMTYNWTFTNGTPPPPLLQTPPLPSIHGDTRM